MAIPRPNVKSAFTEEIKQLKKYLYSESNEDAKRPLLYPFFKKLNPEKFKIESDACGADQSLCLFMARKIWRKEPFLQSLNRLVSIKLKFNIQELTKKVREVLYRLLVEEFRYFE